MDYRTQVSFILLPCSSIRESSSAGNLAFDRFTDSFLLLLLLFSSSYIVYGPLASTSSPISSFLGLATLQLTDDFRFILLFSSLLIRWSHDHHLRVNPCLSYCFSILGDRGQAQADSGKSAVLPFLYALLFEDKETYISCLPCILLSVLHRSYCYPSAPSIGREVRGRPRSQFAANDWFRWRANQSRGKQLLQSTFLAAAN